MRLKLFSEIIVLSLIIEILQKEVIPMFALYEKVIYPGHGVALIQRIVEKDIVGKKVAFYELTFLNKDMTVLVPIDNAQNVGLRHLSSQENITDIFKIFLKPARKITHHEFTASSWNKRNKDYQVKLRNGQFQELLEIYRDLRFIETQKELSFGEKNLLQKTEMLLVEEIALVLKVDTIRALEELRSLCASGIFKTSLPTHHLHELS